MTFQVTLSNFTWVNWLRLVSNQPNNWTEAIKHNLATRLKDTQVRVAGVARTCERPSQTHILTPNIHYLVVILRFVVIYGLWSFYWALNARQPPFVLHSRISNTMVPCICKYGRKQHELANMRLMKELKASIAFAESLPTSAILFLIEQVLPQYNFINHQTEVKENI